MVLPLVTRLRGTGSKRVVGDTHNAANIVQPIQYTNLYKQLRYEVRRIFVRSRARYRHQPSEK